MGEMAIVAAIITGGSAVIVALIKFVPSRRSGGQIDKVKEKIEKKTNELHGRISEIDKTKVDQSFCDERSGNLMKGQQRIEASMDSMSRDVKLILGHLKVNGGG